MRAYIVLTHQDHTFRWRAGGHRKKPRPGRHVQLRNERRVVVRRHPDSSQRSALSDRTRGLPGRHGSRDSATPHSLLHAQHHPALRLAERAQFVGVLSAAGRRRESDAGHHRSPLLLIVSRAEEWFTYWPNALHLSYSVFMLLVAENMPATSEFVPLIGKVRISFRSIGVTL